MVRFVGRGCLVAVVLLVVIFGFLIVVVDGFFEGGVAEDGAVELVLGETTEKVAEFFGGDVGGGRKWATFGEFGESRGRGDGAGATVGFPGDVFYVFFFFRAGFSGGDADFDEHLVAADGVADDSLSVASPGGFVAHEKVSRGEKMVLDDFGVGPRSFEGGSFAGFLVWFRHRSPLV